MSGRQHSNEAFIEIPESTYKVEKLPAGSIAERVEYQTHYDDEKMRRWRGWQSMMDEGNSSFPEMFGLTRYQKPLVEIAKEYGLDAAVLDVALIDAIYYRKHLNDLHSEISEDKRDVEAFLKGKATLLELMTQEVSYIYKQPSEDAIYQPVDETLPSEQLLDHFRETEIARAEQLVLRERDDVYVNIGDPFEWTNVNRDTRRDANGQPTTYLVEYSPGDYSNYIGIRTPSDMVGIHQLSRATDPENDHSTIAGKMGSMPSMLDEIMEFVEENPDLLAGRDPDKKWLNALEKTLYRAANMHQELANSTRLGDYIGSDGRKLGGKFEELEEMRRLWEEILLINQRRVEEWRDRGKDATRLAYDTSEGFSPIDVLARNIDINADNILSAATGFSAMLKETPKTLNTYFEELADAHMQYMQGIGPEIDSWNIHFYDEAWAEIVQKYIPGYSTNNPEMVALHDRKLAEMLFDFFRTNGFQVINYINPRLYDQINTEVTANILEKNPHTPKTTNAALLEEVFPNTTLPTGGIDRITACWSLSRQAMTLMTDEERQDIFAEIDRVLRSGGRATIYPMDYWGDRDHPPLDETSLEDMLSKYKRDTGSNLEYEFRYAAGDWREHLVLILKKP